MVYEQGEIGVSYYEIGGNIQTSRVSETASVTVIPSESDAINPDNVERRTTSGVCYANSEQSYYLPYSYGNPLVNVAANVLLRSFDMVGLGPEEELAY